MSVIGYLSDTMARVRTVGQIEGRKEKITLLFYQILQQTPRTLRKRLKVIDDLIGFMSKKLPFDKKRVNVDGITYVTVDGQSIRLIQKEWESWMQNYIKPEKGSVFIDVGANVGKYSLMFSKMIGNTGKIIAIEPVPNTFEALTEAIKLNKFDNIVPLNIACWNKNTKLNMFQAEMSGESTIKEDYGLGYFAVEARTLDSIVHELGLNTVDSVKIDVEGSEIEVLEGMENILKQHTPEIVIEIHQEHQKHILTFAGKFNYRYKAIEETKNSDSGICYYYLQPMSSHQTASG